MKKSKSINERHNTEKSIEIEQNLMEKSTGNGEMDFSKESLEANDVQIFQFKDKIISYQSTL